MRNVHPEVFRLYNNVNTRSIDKRTIHDLVFWKKRLPKDYKDILEKIINQFNDIQDSFKPLIEMGISFDLWLVGGSVRDLLLGNGHLIKDLDIMLSFNQGKSPMIPKAKVFMKKSKIDFTNPVLQPIIYREGSSIAFSHWDFLETKTKDYKVERQKTKVRKVALFDMLVCSLSKNLDPFEIYKPSLDASKDEKITEKYVDSRLDGVIKLRKEGWTWPVDILVTNNTVDAFLTAFDFGICKIAMELVRGSDIREQRKILPQNPSNLMKRIRLTKHFLDDLQNKQLSMSISEGMSLRQVQHSCENHLERLEKKYPWKLKINVEESTFDANSLASKSNSDVRSEYLEAFFLKRKLDKNLDKKESNKKVVKKV